MNRIAFLRSSDYEVRMKKAFRRYLLPLVLFIALGSPALAGGKKKKAPEHHDTVISAVTPSEITIKADKETKTFPINQFTEIAFKGQKAGITDLKPGMAVSVTVAADGTTASRINANDPPVHHDDTRKPVKPPSWMK